MYKFYALYIFTVYGLAAGAAQNGPAGCVLPPYPPHGTYAVYDRPETVPGQTYGYASLTVTCNPGYGVVGSNITYCIGGNIWWPTLPKCTRFCRLTRDPSVKYSCKVTGDDILSGTRKCHEWEPDGTVVVPECNRPVYYSSGILLNMRCVQGNWDHIAVCQPDCGTSTPIGERLIINGTRVKHGEFPWHAAIYDKTYTPFKQVCGGSLISTKVIISAAHCFWKDATGRQPASRYAVALGKIYRPWNNAMDPGVHHSHVSEIKIPVRFMGGAGNYQADIALVVMATKVVYVTYIRPVCIDFDVEFDRNQLQNTNAGRVSGWGLTSEDGNSSQVLLTTQLPYVDEEKCITDLPDNFKPYVTGDKFCAGGNATTVCRGDSGGGLAFPHMDRATRRYFLRGVVSSAPVSGHKCNTNSYVTFTSILFHATFIKDHGLDVVPVHDGSVGGCVLPAYPPHGTYTVHNRPDAAPGQTHDTAILTVYCDPGHRITGGNTTYCFGSNIWQEPMPQCSHERETCQPNQILCSNRRCVLKSWVCDGEDDCTDGSDEQNCPAALPGEPCLTTQYTCADRQCVPRNFHCDRQIDCKDSSDEIGCSPIYIRKEPQPSCVELNPGEMLNLQCEAVGVPVPIIVWYHNLGHVPRKCVSKSVNGIGTLSCPDMQAGDAGKYSCEALAARGSAFAAHDSVVHINTTSACPS